MGPSVSRWAPPALYALLALVLLGPVLGDPTGLALGHERADTWNHVWGYGHVAGALASGQSPLDAPGVGFPTPGRVYFVDLLGALITLPVGWTLGAVAAFNTALWGNLVLSGVGAWLLARHVTRSEPGAVLAGVVYLLSPHVLGQLHNGISETVATGWIPLAVLAWMRLIEAPTRRRGCWWGAAVGLSGLANWYYGLFVGAMTALLVAHAALVTPARLKAARAAMVAGVGVGVALVIPAGLAFRASLGEQGALVTRDPAFVWATLVGHNMTDLLAFFVPGDFHSPDLLARWDEQLLVVVYVGWVVLALALWGWLTRRDGATRAWTLGASVCFVLALGPFLYVNGHYLRVGESLVPLPFLALFDLVPAVSRISHAYRLAVPLSLCMALLCALAVRRRPAWVAVLAGLAVALEATLGSPAIVPLPSASAAVPAVYADLPDGAVVDLPASLQVLDRGRYNLYQLAHHQPIPYGLNDPTPVALRGNPLTAALLELERSPVRTLPQRLPVLALELGRRSLVDQGFGSVVVHRELYPDGHADKVLALLEIVCGPGVEVGSATRFELRLAQGAGGPGPSGVEGA